MFPQKKLKMHRNLFVLFPALSALGVGIAGGGADAQSVPEWHDTFVARVEAVAIVETLNATLLAARSATFTLDQWGARSQARRREENPRPARAQRRQAGYGRATAAVAD